MDFNNQNVSIFSCQFEAYVEKAKVQIKFPCNYFLQWKANNGKVIVSSQNRYQANKSQIVFNQTLSINVNILYDKVNKKYLKKESLLMINLISKSRPDQIKLVGRVAIDLADVLNANSFDQLSTSQLEYCSVEASLSFFVKSISIKESTMHVSELDRSSFNQYMSFQANLKPHQGFMPRNQGSSTHRDFDDDKSAKGSQQRQIRSLGRDKNKMSSPSLTKQVYTPSNRPVQRNQVTTLQQLTKMNRSNSIPNQLQNPNKFFSPKTIDTPVQNESNFSFHKNTEDNSIKSKTSTPQFSNNENRQSTSAKVIIPEIVLPKQITTSKPKDLKIKVENSNTQGISKPQLISTVLSPKKSQQQLIKRFKQQDETISERQAVIKKLQSQVEARRQVLPVENSFTSSIKDSNTKRFSMELSKTNSQSKRIIGLTQALNELQSKYTKLTLQTEELRSSWRKEKQDLLNTITWHQSALNSKDKQIRQKNKFNQILQHNCQELQKSSNQRLAELIYAKSQLKDSQNQCQKFNEEKKKVEQNLMKLESELKSLHQQSSLGQDQLNKSFGDRLALYQQKIAQGQNKLLEQLKEKKTLSEKIILLQSEKAQLSSKYSALEEENKTYLAQIQQSHNELFGMREQTQNLKKQIQRKQKESREQKQRIWSSKDQEVSYQLKLKDQQIDRIKQENQSKILKLQEQTNIQIQRLSSSEQSLKTKIEQLQNTIFTLSDQVTNYQEKIANLSQQLQLKEKLLSEVSHQHKNISEEQRQIQGEHQELLLSLSTQIEEHQSRIKLLQSQLSGLNNALQQKDLQLLKSHQQTQAHRLQLQLTKVQSTIYQSKLLQQRQYYQKQAQSISVSCSQQVYQIQIQLQQQLDRYQQLQHIKNMLKDSLDQWQNKCTDDKIASSKTVGRLNDIIKQKQQTMYEMENIMRTLEKDKQLMQQHVYQQHAQYTQVLNNYKLKQVQLKQSVQMQENDFVKLYEAVKLERIQLKQNINSKGKTIQQLQKHLQQSNTKITQLNSTLQSVRQSLQTSQSSLIELNSQSQEKIVSLKNQHNQQVDEYEQRIRQLQNIITQRDNQLLDKQTFIIEQQRQKNDLKAQIQERIHQSKMLNEKISQLLVQIESLHQQSNKLISQNQSLKLNTEQHSQKYTNLENTFIQCEERLGNRIKELQAQKSQLMKKITELGQLSTQHQQNIKTIQDNFNLKLQQLNNQHIKTLQQTKQLQKINQSQLSNKLQTLEDDLIRLNETILQKTQHISTLQTEKAQLQRQLTQLKTQRQTMVMINYKQQIQRLKQQIKQLNQQNLQLKNQLKQIPSLQRTIKIKTIELNSLKYKSSTSYSSNAVDPDQVSHVEEIIKLKNQQIQVLKKENEKIKDLQLQLYQVESLNEELYQNIEQYEEEKFHLNSGLNEKEIKIAELQVEVQTLANSKAQLKEKTHDLSEKLKYYENLIMDFKGHEMSSTKSQSDKLNTSRISSNKLINQTETQSNNKLQLDTFIKKIKLLQIDLQKLKIKDQQNLNKQQSYLTQINEYEEKISSLEELIKQKDTQLTKKISVSRSPIQQTKPQVQYKNPQQVVQTFKQIQGLLKKRSDFHNLQTTLIKLHESNSAQVHKDRKQDQQTKEKLANTNAHINVLSKEFQNLKAKIMKLEGKNYQEKAKFISLLRPCEQSLRQVTKLYQNNESSRHNSAHS